jgi:hypothetical protein
MALELRPNCEWCDRDLPPASTLARICSFECTFCADCVDEAAQCLPELRRRLRAAPDPTVEGVAVRPLGRDSAALEQARASFL